MAGSETNPLELATREELANELRNRFDNCIIYGEWEEEDGYKFVCMRHGDRVRLLGVVHGRIMPHMMKEVECNLDGEDD